MEKIATEKSKLRQVREDKGMSLRELAMRARIYQADMSYLERGLSPAFPAWRRRIAAVLMVPEDVLFPNIKKSVI